jgi:hypothetical protein
MGRNAATAFRIVEFDGGLPRVVMEDCGPSQPWADCWNLVEVRGSFQQGRDLFDYRRDDGG